MKYTSAILGCGPRSVSHVRAYEGIDEISLRAVCDRDRRRLNACLKRFHVPAGYGDLDEMLSREKPDILHIVTPPDIREQPMETAARHGVRGIIVEKPIALNPSQAGTIRELAEKERLKIAVNMQRRYFHTCVGLKNVLDAGTIGKIDFIRCVTKGNILSMGPHMVDLLLYLLGDIEPQRVWATAWGMNGYDYNHPAPANMLIEYVFPGNTVVYCEDAEQAVGTEGENDYWQHLEYDIWGAKGRAWWLQNREWGYHAEGQERPVIHPTRWADSDIPGQRAFTRAMAAWLADDARVHRNCLENALRGFDVIMATLQSAWEGKPLSLPAPILPDIARRIEERLK